MEIQRAIGFNLVCLVITIVCILPVSELTLQEKIKLITAELLLMATLTLGIGLLIL